MHCWRSRSCRRVADAEGYAGSCALLLWRNFAWLEVEWLTVFRYALYGTAVAGFVLVTLSMLYFNSRKRVLAPSAAWPAARDA